MTDAKPMRKPLLSEDAYDIIKMITQYWLPAAGTLYFGLSQIWPLPYAEEVVGTIVVVVLFLGVLLGYSKYYYERSGDQYAGEFVVDTHNPLKDTYSLNITQPLEGLENKKEIRLKIATPPSSQ